MGISLIIIIPSHGCNRKLTGAVELLRRGGLYKNVCHVPKHDAHERKSYSVDDGTEKPCQDQDNVQAFCKPKLHSCRGVSFRKDEKQKHRC